MDKNAIPFRQTHLPPSDEDVLMTRRAGKLLPMTPWVADSKSLVRELSGSETFEDSRGWLHAPALMLAEVQQIEEFGAEILNSNFRDIVMLGSAQASLVAEVLASTFPPAATWPKFRVLTSTMPERLRTLERNVDLKSTLFVVVGQSQLTIRTAAQLNFFLERVKARAATPPGRSFVVIANAGSPLEEIARRERFRRVFINSAENPRSSSLFSYFGLVPAAMLGMDVGALLERTMASLHEGASDTPVDRNSGVRLGAALAALKRAGRDKVHLLLAPQIATFGLWLSSLIADTGAGIVPVVDEPAIALDSYGADRAFVCIRLKDSLDDRHEQMIEAVKRRGFPTIEIALADKLDLGAEFLRWEVAAATLTSALDVEIPKPTEPEVEELAGVAEGRSARAEAIATEGELSLFSSECARDSLHDAGSLADKLGKFFDLSAPGGYLAIAAFIAPSPAVEREIAALRRAVAERRGIATLFNYDSLFVSSPDSEAAERGLFVQITQHHRDLISVPGQSYDFASLEAARQQAQFEALDKGACRAIRIHLGGDDPIASLSRLRQLLVPTPAR